MQNNQTDIQSYELFRCYALHETKLLICVKQ